LEMGKPWKRLNEIDVAASRHPAEAVCA